MPPRDGDLGVQHRRSRGGGAPGGLHGIDRLERALQPDGDRFAGDGRVFVAEKGGLIRSSTVEDTTATIFADLRSKVHWFWDRASSGWSSTRTSPGATVRLCRSTRTTRGSRHRPRWGDAAPPAGSDRRRLRRQRPALAAQRASPSQVLINDWCQQYPSHSVGSLAFGADGALYVSARRRRELRLRRLRPGRQPASTRAATRPTRRRHPDAAHRRGRRAAQPGRPDARRPDGPGRHRSSASTPTRAPRCPTTRTPAARTQHPPDRRLRAAQPVPLHVPARARTTCTSATSAGTRGRRSTAPQPARRPSRTSAGRATRARAACRATTASNLNICESLYAAGTGAATAPLYAYNHATKVAPTDLPDGQLVGLRPRVLRRRHVPGRVRRRAVLRRLLAQLHLGDVPGADGVPDPATARAVHQRRRPARSTSRSGPGGDLFYADLPAARSGASTRHDANRAPTAVATATPASGTVPLTVQFDGRGSTDPEATR